MRAPASMLSLLWLSSLACGGSPSKPAVDESATPASPDRAVASERSADAEQPAGAEPPAAASTPREPGPPAGPGGADELHRLEGVAEAAVLAEFGEPADKRTFPMKDCCNEFEIELYNTYPPGKGHDDVEIHQWTWAYDGYSLTVWLHDAGKGWEVLETSRYSDDVEF